MEIQKVKITEVKLNPNNPRLIKDDKFAKLVKSLNFQYIVCRSFEQFQREIQQLIPIE